MTTDDFVLAISDLAETWRLVASGLSPSFARSTYLSCAEELEKVLDRYDADLDDARAAWLEDGASPADSAAMKADEAYQKELEEGD